MEMNSKCVRPEQISTLNFAMTDEPPGETHEHQNYDSEARVPYRRIELLGLGSFGVVDKVERTSGPLRGQVYARKILRLPVGVSQREEKQVSIQNEVKIAKSVRHPHAVRLIETYLCRREYAMIMTPAAEENLREYLGRVDGTPLDPGVQELRERIPSWFRCLVSVVAYLHAQKIRHRDIKPSNILIRNGDIFLTDFGTAMKFPGETIPTETETRGTKRYQAPEVAKGHRSGRPADIYSLGVVFLEMLSAHSGFREPAGSSDLRQSNDSQSYASEVDRVSQWIGLLKNVSRDAPWYLTVLFLCRNMLQVERGQRPTADALRLCWSYQPFLALPPTPCECSKSLDNPDRYSVGGTNEALRKALGNGHKLAVYLLIENGTEFGYSGALVVASGEGQMDVVQMLLEKGAYIEAQDKHGRTALHAAAERGRDEVVLLLLNKGSDIRAKDNDDQTALHRAASNGNEATVQLLLSGLANATDKDNDGWTALHVAAKNGHEGVIQPLVGGGADLEAKDNNGLTAHCLAERAKHSAVARLLVRLLVEKREKAETKKNGKGPRLWPRKRRHSQASSAHRTPPPPPEGPPPQDRLLYGPDPLLTPPSSPEDSAPHPHPRQGPGQQLSAPPSSPADLPSNPRPSQGPDLLPTPPPSADDLLSCPQPRQGPGTLPAPPPLPKNRPSQPQLNQGIASPQGPTSPPEDSHPYLGAHQRPDLSPALSPPPEGLSQTSLPPALNPPPTKLLSQLGTSLQTEPCHETDPLHTPLPSYQCHSFQFISKENLRDFYFPAIHRKDTNPVKENTLDSVACAEELVPEWYDFTLQLQDFH
ncbi:MAG: hypothetical protein M1813_001315 [Trichoglossum hirsutum]|nr:MAG: hypothetical protein M1813_001315 [Trichoglossum hirsutum]